MKSKYLLTLALLCSPALYASAPSRVASVLTEDDTCDLVTYMCLRSMNPVNSMTREVVERAKKICMKRVACRHTPDSLREMRVDLPALGDVELLNVDQASEMVYAVLRSLGDKNISEVASKVFVREKLLSVMRSALKNIGDCPVSCEFKNHWLTENGLTEAARYMLDKAVEQVWGKLS